MTEFIPSLSERVLVNLPWTKYFLSLVIRYRNMVQFNVKALRTCFDVELARFWRSDCVRIERWLLIWEKSVKVFIIWRRWLNIVIALESLRILLYTIWTCWCSSGTYRSWTSRNYCCGIYIRSIRILLLFSFLPLCSDISPCCILNSLFSFHWRH